MEDSPIREVKEPKLILGQTIKERPCSKWFYWKLCFR